MILKMALLITMALPERSTSSKSPVCVQLGHLKNDVLIFGAALGFSHHLVHFMPIGTIFSEIDQYLDLPHRL